MSETKIMEARGLPVRKYFRKWARNQVNIPAKLEIILPDGKKITSGTAIIRDISLKGARLAKFVLKKPILPARTFRIKLFFHSEQYKGIGALARPIRFGTGHDFELAVEFEDLWARVEEKK